MHYLENIAGRTVVVKDKEYLFCSGYAYLGMHHVSDFVKLFKEGVDLYGWLHPSARISNTQLKIFNDFEDGLSKHTGQEASISFSSGYLAGRAVHDLFIRNNQVYFLGNCHPVLKDGEQPYTGTMFQLINEINNSTQPFITIISDSVNPLSATIIDFSFVKNIAPDKQITLIIDDSHGIGIIGNNGRGISEFIPLQSNLTTIYTYSLSKAFNINGGGVSSTNTVIEQLAASPFYTGSTPVAPALAHAFLEGHQLYQKQQAKLYENIQYFVRLISKLPSIHYNLRLPFFILPEQLDDHFFAAHQVIISSFSYPDPKGKKINRIVLNALHTKQDLERIASILELYFRG